MRSYDPGLQDHRSLCQQGSVEQSRGGWVLAVATVTAEQGTWQHAPPGSPPPRRRALRPDSGYQGLWGTCRLSGASASQVRFFPAWSIITLLCERPGRLRECFPWEESQERPGETASSMYGRGCTLMTTRFTFRCCMRAGPVCFHPWCHSFLPSYIYLLV